MANQIQLVIYEGYLSADPSAHYTPNGKYVANFNLGSNQSFTSSSGDKVKQTTWLKVSCWGKLGEIISQYCAKGSWVIVTGRLRPSESGSPSVFQLASGDYAASYEVTAASVRILRGKEGAPQDDVKSEEEDDIPF